MQFLATHDQPGKAISQCTDSNVQISAYNTQTTPTKIMDQCLALTLPDGTMRSTVRRSIAQGLEIPVYVLHRQEQTLAWAIVKDRAAMVYVDVRYRRMGYGSELLTHCQQWMQENYNQDVMVCPHDPLSVKFFRQLPYPASPTFAHNMNRY